MPNLVLTRQEMQSITIGDNISITVVRIGPNTVRLGIEAPREMNIVRGELIAPDADKPAPLMTTSIKELAD